MAKDMKFMNKKELRALATEKKVDIPEGAKLKDIRELIAGSQLPLETPSKILSYDEKLKTEPRIWVRLHNRDLSEGVDFGFTFERHRWHLMNGEVTRLPKSVIDHLKAVRYPMVKYKQGEAGQSVKVAGYYYRFAITEVDAPKPVAASV